MASVAANLMVLENCSGRGEKSGYTVVGLFHPMAYGTNAQELVCQTNLFGKEIHEYDKNLSSKRYSTV